jgi:gluconolactonase
MIITRKEIVLLASLYCTGLVVNAQNNHPADSNIIADGAMPRLISRQFSFTEGPATDSKGNVYFTDQPNNKIWKYGIDGRLSVFLDSAGRSNGMYFDRSGNLISCADEQNQLWSIDRKKKIKVLINDVDGKKLNGPNDVWYRRVEIFISPILIINAPGGRGPNPKWKRKKYMCCYVAAKPRNH